MQRFLRVAVIAALLVLPLVPTRASAQADHAPPSIPSRVRAWQTGLLRADRLQHLSLAFTVGLGTGLVTREPASAAGVALGLGLSKEIRDRRHTRFDRLDLLADAVGATLAALATGAATR